MNDQDNPKENLPQLENLNIACMKDLQQYFSITMEFTTESFI